MKRAYPGAWGSTILVNGAPPPVAAPADEKTVRVDRNKLPATMMQGSDESQASAGDATKPRSVAPPPPPAASGRPPAPPSAPEPLRVPSNRPVPAPAPKRAASGTLLMPGAAEQVMAQARQQAFGPDACGGYACYKAAHGDPHQAEAQPRPRRPTPAQPQASTPMSGSSNARTPARAPEPQATAQRPASRAKTEVLNPVKKGSEPIRLALTIAIRCSKRRRRSARRCRATAHR